MKALFISSRPIYPIISGGQIRTEQQLEFLSRKFDVDVVFLTDEKEHELKEYLKFANSVKSFYRPKMKCVIETMRFIFNKLPLQVNYYYDLSLQKYIDSVICNYDMVFCNNLRTAEYVRGKKTSTRVIDFVDAISMNYDKARQYSKGLKRLIYEIEFKRCRTYERLIYDEFDGCSIISEVDKHYIESWQELK